MSTAEAISRGSEAWATLAWAVTWQSAILVALAALLAAALRRASPNLRYWLWQIVAIKVLLMPRSATTACGKPVGWVEHQRAPPNADDNR